MAWTIEYTDTARTQLRKLDRQTARRVLDYMDQRVGASDDPRGGGRRLRGPRGGLWRYRVGDCRMICDIQDAAVRVLVLRIGKRREVYR
ncbi:MAG: type II toxin-antitoxin system RelE/ParE family toxin [Acidobacteria bacterium]|nr:type II toxin-antitoxin system RelE/ParE family toxin [Acidobacteriota bacterium]